MNRRILTRLLTVLATFTLAAVARADLVSFSTSGDFNGGGNSIQFGAGADTLTINFTGVTQVDLNDDPFTFTSLGQFQTITTGNGADITVPTNFTLTINQTAPAAGSNAFTATIDGTVVQNQSSGLVTFAANAVTIGGETYTLFNNPLPLVPPATNEGFTSVQAQISPVPEPGVTGLLLISMPALLFRIRRLTRA